MCSKFSTAVEFRQQQGRSRLQIWTQVKQQTCTEIDITLHQEIKHRDLAIQNLHERHGNGQQQAITLSYITLTATD